MIFDPCFDCSGGRYELRIALFCPSGFERVLRQASDGMQRRFVVGMLFEDHSLTTPSSAKVFRFIRHRNSRFSLISTSFLQKGCGAAWKFTWSVPSVSLSAH